MGAQKKMGALVEEIQSKQGIAETSNVLLCQMDDTEEIVFDGENEEKFNDLKFEDVFELGPDTDVIYLGLYNIYAEDRNIAFYSRCSDNCPNKPSKDCEEDMCSEFIIVGGKHAFEDHPITVKGSLIEMRVNGWFKKKKYVQLKLINPKKSKSEEDKIVTEVYKIFVDGLKSVTINKKDQKLTIERISGSEEISLNDLTSEYRKPDRIFHDKDKKSKWDRWGKDVTKIIAGGVFKLGGAAIGLA